MMGLDTDSFFCPQRQANFGLFQTVDTKTCKGSKHILKNFEGHFWMVCSTVSSAMRLQRGSATAKSLFKRQHNNTK